MILLPADARQSFIDLVTVEPVDLAAAHERDSAASSPTNPDTNPRAMNDGLDRTGFSVVVKNRARMPKPWRSEIYRAERTSPIARSEDYFESRSTANLEGKAALELMLNNVHFSDGSFFFNSGFSSGLTLTFRSTRRRSHV